MIVIMPGGFHPFHAGHASLYQSALKAFPNADVYVAATNDTKTRPFPFEIKEKLAKLAGVAPGRFVQVKSPFQAKEITQNYDPEQDVLVFVRSEKDRDEQPKPGGTKKDGSPAYFQPYTGKNLQPFSKHGYIAYLPTVEFGPGIKSATEIRNAWPKLDDRRKLAMVMSLYPKTQDNQKLAQTVVKMLDAGMGAGEEVTEGIFDRFKKKPTRDDFIREKLSQMSTEELRSQLRDYKSSIPSARASGSLVGGAVSDYANAIQRELDKRAFNDFTAKNPNWDKGMNIDEVAGRLTKLPKNYNPDGATYRGGKNRMPVLEPDPAQDAEPLSAISGSYEMDMKPLELEKLKKVIATNFERLDDREQQILVHRFGLDGEEPMTLLQVSELLNVGPNRIRQLEARAIRKLKHINSARKFRPFLDVMEEDADQLYTARMANITDDLGGGYFLGDDSYYDDEGFEKESYKVYYQEGPDEFRSVGYVNISPYPQNRKPGDFERSISKLIANDRMNVSEEKDEKGSSGVEKVYNDPEVHNILAYAQQHYPEEPDLQSAFVKFVLRSLKHSEDDDQRQDNEIELLLKRVNSLQNTVDKMKDKPAQKSEKVDESADYLREK